MTNPHVLVIGAGFGGIEVCKQLKKSSAKVSLVDRHNYHLFQPLLYQVAGAALSPADIAYPIRTIFRRQKNVHVYLAEAQNVDLKEQAVKFDDDDVSHYDYLVLAAGATHSYFGRDDWQDEAPGLKTIDDATEIRKRILLAFEEAEYESDEEARRAKLTFVIIGGGPTGVELAGVLREIACDTIPDDFRNVDTSTARIILIQASSRVLPGFSEKASAVAKQNLERMGVEVLLNSRVTAVDETGVQIGDKKLLAENIFWAAGVQASPLGMSLGVPLDHNGRVVVDEHLAVPGHPEVFVIGDMAAAKDARTGALIPGVAQGAIQAGMYVGKRIARQIEDKAPQSKGFTYFDKGNMATIGRAKAVADIGRFHFSGIIAWFMWSVVHVLFLVSFRNRLFVVLSWIGNWFLSSRGARLITGKTKFRIRKFTQTVPHDRPDTLSEKQAMNS